MVQQVVESGLSRWWRIQQAPASIYGTLIGASVMAVSDEEDPVVDVAVAIVITLLIYWAAERWSAVLGAYFRGRPLATRDAVRIFAQGYPMVQASFLPLFVMVVVRAFGASDGAAVSAALLTSIATLTALGGLAGRRVGLRGGMVVLSAVFTGALGFAVVLLKAVLH